MKLKSFLSFLLVLLHLLLSGVVVAAAGTAHSNGTFVVGNRTVLSSWQSSYFGSSCFWGRSAEKEDEMARGHRSYPYMYLHSEGYWSADSGFHWLVLQLNNTVYVTSVSVHGRNDEVPPTVYNRAAGIEIWTSPRDVTFSGADHCSARNLSQYFINSKSQWEECGVTKPSDINVTKGEILTVNCTVEVKMLLLRLNVSACRTDGTTYSDGYMSFTGITLTLGKRDEKPDSQSNQAIVPFVWAAATILVAAGIAGILVALAAVAMKATIKCQQQPRSGLGEHKFSANTTSGGTVESSAVSAVNSQANRAVYYSSSAEALDHLPPQQQTQSSAEECSYETVQPIDDVTAAALRQLASSEASLDVNSDCTVYLSIVGDGDEV